MKRSQLKLGQPSRWNSKTGFISSFWSTNTMRIVSCSSGYAIDLTEVKFPAWRKCVFLQRSLKYLHHFKGLQLFKHRWECKDSCGQQLQQTTTTAEIQRKMVTTFSITAILTTVATKIYIKTLKLPERSTVDSGHWPQSQRLPAACNSQINPPCSCDSNSLWQL